MKFTNMALATVLAASASAALAQDEPKPAVTITGSAALVSDYRFRGASQSNENIAVQGSINLNHESGFYVGTWASSIELAGYGGTEVDLYGGWKKDFSGTMFDIGALYYYYPGGASGADTDFVEFYASLSHTFGPIGTKLGVAYAPKQNGIGDESNLYTYGDLTAALPNTPITLKAHLGYSKGDSFLGGGDDYIDYSVGADFVWKNLTLGVAYVDTDLKSGSVGAGLLGPDNVDSTVVVSLTAGF